MLVGGFHFDDGLSNTWSQCCLQHYALIAFAHAHAQYLNCYYWIMLLFDGLHIIFHRNITFIKRTYIKLNWLFKIDSLRPGQSRRYQAVAIAEVQQCQSLASSSS